MKKLLILFLFFGLFGCNSIVKNKQVSGNFNCPRVFFSSEDRIFIDTNEDGNSIDYVTFKAELNKIYNGKVMKIMEFGAFVNFLGKQDGLVHISELADKRVAKVTDVVKEGDEVKVKVIGFDRGKVKLSIKQAAI